MNREDDAIASFRRQIAVSPRDVYAHDNLSLSLAAKNQWEEACLEAVIATEITPEDAVKWAGLARTQVKTGRIDEPERASIVYSRWFTTL